MAGKLVAVVGAMGSGKTEKLIDIYEKFTKAGISTCVFKPAIDNRYGNNAVKSRNGKELEAISISSLEEILEMDKEPPQVILIDEIQFFDQPNASQILTSITLVGIDVYVFGLDVTSEDTTFGMVGDILAHADEVVKLKVKCVRCGQDARISHFKGEDKTSDIRVGDLDVYEPLCKDCYYIEEKNIEQLLDDSLLEEERYVFTFDNHEFSAIVAVTGKELEDAGYTPEDVLDIISIDAVKNLLKDLGYGEMLDE